MSDPGTRPAKPYGRDETKAELLAAARKLFGERGYDAVSVRDISKAANVNHALLHRHFGTKEVLLHELMRAEAARFKQVVDGVRDPVEALQRLSAANAADLTFVRILAYSLLSGIGTDDLLASDGALKQIVDALIPLTGRVANSGVAADDVREVTAAVTALTLGWLLFEPFVTAATGIDEAHLPQARARVRALVEELVQLPPGGSAVSPAVGVRDRARKSA